MAFVGGRFGIFTLSGFLDRIRRSIHDNHHLAVYDSEGNKLARYSWQEVAVQYTTSQFTYIGEEQAERAIFGALPTELSLPHVGERVRLELTTTRFQVDVTLSYTIALCC